MDINETSIRSMAVDEILDLYECISQDVEKQLKDIITSEPDPDYSLLCQGHNVQQNQDMQALQENYQNDKVCLEEIKDQVHNLKVEKDNIKSQIAKDEQKLKLLNAKKESLNKKKTELQEKRDIIQVCKLLTNTSFTYQGSDLMGYSFCPTSGNIEPFEFKYTVPQEEVTRAMYNIIESISESGKESE